MLVKNSDEMHSQVFDEAQTIQYMIIVNMRDSDIYSCLWNLPIAAMCRLYDSRQILYDGFLLRTAQRLIHLSIHHTLCDMLKGLHHDRLIAANNRIPHSSIKASSRQLLQTDSGLPTVFFKPSGLFLSAIQKLQKLLYYFHTGWFGVHENVV